MGVVIVVAIVSAYWASDRGTRSLVATRRSENNRPKDGASEAPLPRLKVKWVATPRRGEWGRQRTKRTRVRDKRKRIGRPPIMLGGAAGPGRPGCNAKGEKGREESLFPKKTRRSTVAGAELAGYENESQSVARA